MDEFKRKCFFCSEIIEGKKSMEHVVPNSLLGKLEIKEVKVSGDRTTQYSRIKVPSHAKCNNEFGSAYEDKVFGLLENIDELYDILLAEEGFMPMMCHPDDSATSIISTWLSKIYYGMFYDDYLKTKDDSWREICLSIIESENFKFVKNSYKNGHGFQLPSSLYVFKTSNEDTDLVTMVSPSCILFKIKKITFILCVCDGFLTKNYLLGDSLNRLREFVEKEDKNNIEFPSHKLALGEILALRGCIPKNPKFIFSENEVINMSLSTMAANPSEAYSIDMETLKIAREEIFDTFNIKIMQSNT
jgi:hypothetical protein